MQEVSVPTREHAAPRLSLVDSSRDFGGQAPKQPWADRRVEELHLMLSRFAASGGVATGDEIAGRMRSSYDRPVSQLARWIVDHDVVSFTWGSVILLPVFQFVEPGMIRQSAVKDVLSELRGFMDDWSCALWFATPSGWLDGALPADALLRKPSAVHQASRADRFSVLG